MIKLDLVDAEAAVEDMVVVEALGIVALARTGIVLSWRMRQSPRRHARSTASFFDSELDHIQRQTRMSPAGSI
jgi:hypothetical protein